MLSILCIVSEIIVQICQFLRELLGKKMCLLLTELFRLLRLVYGTVYRSTSYLRSHCQSSTVASRHISSGAASRDYIVVPEK